ncbi:MAG: peptide chain release factor 2 [Patescibacteria group bacterium]
MQDIKQRIIAINERFASLQKSLNLAAKRERLSELEREALDSSLWDDPEKARGLTQDLASLKKEIEEIEELKGTVETLAGLLQEDVVTPDLEKEVESTEKSLEKLELTSYLSGRYDAKNVILSIHAGQGGVEAMDWASMLLRMYLRYCERKGFKTETLDFTAGEEAGVKSVTFRVAGKYAYGYLKGEAGTHRLVRQSPFNADRLRQTSFALVEVLPELTAVDLPEIEIKEEDLDWQFFRASSQGGQNVQKVSTAVRLTHKPTGIVVTSQSERFQEQNRKIALNLLRAKLWLRTKEEEAEERKQLKGEYRPASWGNQIRSYVLHPYKMVKDLRTQIETANTQRVLAGEIDEFIAAQLKTKNK